MQCNERLAHDHRRNLPCRSTDDAAHARRIDDDAALKLTLEGMIAVDSAFLRTDNVCGDGAYRGHAFRQLRGYRCPDQLLLC